MAEDDQTRAAAEDSRALLQGLQMPDDQSAAQKAQLIQQLTDADDLNASDDSLDNLLTTDIPSANFGDAESLEFRHYLDVILERKRAAYPHDKQIVIGALRAFVHDDPSANRQPVDSKSKLVDETFKQGIAARITKGKQGTLIGQALRSIRESRVHREADAGGGGLLGKIRG